MTTPMLLIAFSAQSCFTEPYLEHDGYALRFDVRHACELSDFHGIEIFLFMFDKRVQFKHVSAVLGKTKIMRSFSCVDVEDDQRAFCDEQFARFEADEFPIDVFADLEIVQDARTIRFNNIPVENARDEEMRELLRQEL